MPAEKEESKKSNSNCNRRSNKPLMEKRRRARINQSLTELKNLIMDACVKKEQTSRSSKLEKADILELTVKHVQRLQKQQSKAPEIGDIAKYQDGFRQCQHEVTLFMESTGDFDSELRNRLSNHLVHRFTQLQSTDTSKPEVSSESKCEISETSEPQISSNVQLIPTRLLPTGEIAFMLPFNKQNDFINQLKCESNQLWKQNDRKYNNKSGLFHQQDLNKHESMWRPW